MLSLWFVWSAVLIALLISGIFTENSVLIFITAVFVVYALLSVIINRTVKHKISVTFSFPDNAQKNTDINGKVILHNNSRFLLYGAADIYIKIQNKLTGEAVSRKIKLSSAPKGVSKADLCIKSRNCGMISVSVENVRLYDFTGLTFKTVGLESICEIPVLPDLNDIHTKVEIKSISECCDGDYTSYSPYFSGNNMSEIFELCEYSEGDSLKSVNHKLSAKRNRLIVKKGSLPTENSLLIVFDNISDSSENNPDLISHMAEIFISLSQDLTEKNIAYTALWISENGNFIESEKTENSDDSLLLVNRILSAGFVKSDVSVLNMINDEALSYSAVIFVTCRKNLPLNDELFTVINVNAERSDKGEKN